MKIKDPRLEDIDLDEMRTKNLMDVDETKPHSQYDVDDSKIDRDETRWRNPKHS